MTSLLTSQLVLEGIGRELRTTQGADAAREAIRCVEQYVHDIVKDWEDHGLDIVEGKPTRELEELEKLRAFLGPATAGFEEKATEPMEQLEEFIRGKVGVSDRLASSRRTFKLAGPS